MKKILIAVVWLLLMTTAAYAGARIGSSWGDRGTMSLFTRNAGKMLVDPVFLGGLAICLAVASRFVVWGMLVVGGLAGPVALFISLNTLGGTGYHRHGVTMWVAAVFLGAGIGLAAVLALRIIGPKE
jgi:hypothetical protein